LGGLVWHHFQYVYGLYLMGHDVLFVEDSDDYASCYNPETYQMSTDPSYGLDFISSVFSRYGLENKWAYFDFHAQQWYGRPEKEVLDFLQTADVLLNISGVNPVREWMMSIPRRVLIDTDPVFTQIRHLQDDKARRLAETHHLFLTFGENIGREDCTIPDDGFPWRATRQPIVMELWTPQEMKPGGKWTTVMQWDSYKTAVWNNHEYGMKSKSFELYLELPSMTDEVIELALGSESAPADRLEAKGWHIADPLLITRTPESYRHYILQSKGEWGVAKHGYVATYSGWFSERSAVYLASGKPVIVQDTGFSKNIKCGEGLFAFDDPDALPEIFDWVNGKYSFHCQRAREICGEYFDHRKVLEGVIG
jgi:hypothetical protein